jgi:AraC-like DNA-binding protein
MQESPRYFGQAPIPPHSLPNWHFSVVTTGNCGVILGNREMWSLRTQCLWIFPPGFEHGWHGDQEECNVVSFQVEEVPAQLFSAVKKIGFLEIELSADQLEEIIEMKGTIHPDFYVRDLVNELHFDRAIIQMSLMALGKVMASAKEIARARAEKSILNALNAFRRNLKEPSAIRWRKMTKAAGVSSAKLRSFFVSFLNKTAHQVMTDVRVEMATELLEDTSIKLDSIATESGFGSYRAFARAFADRKACCPLVWRLKRRVIAQELPESMQVKSPSFSERDI